MPPRHRLRFRRCRRLVALLAASITICAAPRSTNAGTFPCMSWTGSNCVFPRPFDCSSVNACATVWPLYELSYHDVANSARFSNVTSNVRVFLMGIFYRPSRLKFQGFRHKQADQNHRGRTSRSSNNRSARRVVCSSDRLGIGTVPYRPQQYFSGRRFTILHPRWRLEATCARERWVIPAECAQSCAFDRDCMPRHPIRKRHCPPRVHNLAPSTRIRCPWQLLERDKPRRRSTTLHPR